ncbi:UNVERIFIED_CONTAM: hypothetical protein Slati_2515300 [Sesamum latifolium]|uniref:Uncharacterized protein n=1 Tax=Sesamum latifolium TaxID=2727402 RepID=A0AAW2WEZ9_9LAMI
MFEERVDEQAIEDFLIDLQLSPITQNSTTKEKRCEEKVSSSRKRISREESERRKTEDTVVASGAASYRVFQSCIKEGDLGVIRARFGIPDDFLIQVPTSSERPHLPPEGFVGFYVAQLEVGLRFPVPSFFAEVSTLFKIPLNQLVPKAFSILVGFYILVRNLDETPSAAQFHSFFLLKKTSHGLFYFTSRGDAHFLPSDTSVKEWKRHYFFVSSPIPWSFPTKWVPAAPYSPRYSTRTRPTAFQALLESLSTFHYDPRELIHPALLFRFGLSLKEVFLDTTAGIIPHIFFIPYLCVSSIDKAFGESKNPGTGSSSKRSSAKSTSSTPASSTSTRDPKEKRQVEHMSPPAKKPKVSSGSLLHLRLNLLHGLILPALQGLLTALDRTFLEALPRDQAMHSLASYASKAILLIGDLLERGGPVAEETQRKVGELEKELQEKERLADAPEPDEEVPQELPENLFHVPLKGAPADPEDAMVEDVVPLKVVPLLLMIALLLLPPKNLLA